MSRLKPPLLLLFPAGLAACGGGGDGPAAPGGGSALMAWTFDRDLDGWAPGTADGGRWPRTPAGP